MYIISIVIKNDLFAEQNEDLLAKHRAWFKKHFETGQFILLGPYVDTDEPAGVIIADVADRATLDSILADDAYYPNLAQYDVREFDAKLVAGAFAK